MIANAVSFNRKNDRKSQAQISAETLQEAKMASAGEYDENREAKEKDAQSQGLLMIPEFQFDHAVYMITENKMSEEGL